jgi:hypothetical protein
MNTFLLLHTYNVILTLPISQRERLRLYDGWRSLNHRTIPDLLEWCSFVKTANLAYSQTETKNTYFELQVTIV